ncbi:hypothetical protein [Cyanobium sp. Morenito 9A2]|uniref:hypothetical protein n=1 Tax=Cyanobium sp. Morenito 9A2 TaxID=2823718 RepID=UPI0020CE2E31|nr:hypothetical protein [Cyanobium sp. Morenito 9A2]MCP9849872.1 hypothetical protein [Cyanobium sp. Morenito 9A2]
MTVLIGHFTPSSPQERDGASTHPAGHRTREAAETYFECITTCSLDDGECVTRCVEQLRELN